MLVADRGEGGLELLGLAAVRQSVVLPAEVAPEGVERRRHGASLLEADAEPPVRVDQGARLEDDVDPGAAARVEREEMVALQHSLISRAGMTRECHLEPRRQPMTAV